MFKKTGRLLSIVVMGMLLAAGCGNKEAPAENAQEEKIIIKAAHSTTTDYPYQIGLEKFAESVKEKTNGQVEVQIFPNGQLGSNEREVVESLQLGTVNMTVVNGAVITNFVPKADVFNLPFIFKNTQHLYKTVDGEAGDIVAKELEAKGVKVLAWWSAPERSIFNSKKPIEKLEDLKGLKIRVTQNPVSIATFNALGALATPMAYGEVYSGMQQRAIDGAENDPLSYDTMKFYEVAKYYSITNHFMVACPFIIDLKYFNGLPQEIQQAISEAAVIGRDEMRTYTEKRVEETLKALQEKGAIVNKIEDLSPFRKAVEPVYQEFESKIGKDLIDLVRNAE